MAGPGYRWALLGSLGRPWVRPRASERARHAASSGCSSPSRVASAPVSRWRSRRWPGWSAASRPPVYCYHEIVHNRVIVERFEAQGVVFVDDIAEVPPGSPIMLSAHGSAPGRRRRRRGARQLRRRLGVPARHQGAPRGPGPGRQGLPHRVRRPRGPRGGGRHDGRRPRLDDPRSSPSSEVEALPDFDEPVALLAQTTLSHRDWGGVAVAVRERFPDVWSPGRSDLCFATTNRQSALMELAKRCDAIVVIGSANSSNTVALEKLAREAGLPIVCRGSTRPTSCPPSCCADARIVGRHRRRVGARRARRRRRSTASAPTRRRRGRARSPPRTSTSRRRATCASCRSAIEHGGHGDARRLAGRPPPHRRPPARRQRRPDALAG